MVSVVQVAGRDDVITSLHVLLENASATIQVQNLVRTFLVDGKLNLYDIHFMRTRLLGLCGHAMGNMGRAEKGLGRWNSIKWVNRCGA